MMDVEWNVPPGTSSAPIAKAVYRLCAPLRWWSESIVRIVALEICNLPRRIQACLREPHLRYGAPLELPCPADCVWDDSGLESKFLHSCMNDMQKLSLEHRWAGNLERRMAAQAYALGAEWALCNSCNRVSGE